LIDFDFELFLQLLIAQELTIFYVLKMLNINMKYNTINNNKKKCSKSKARVVYCVLLKCAVIRFRDIGRVQVCLERTTGYCLDI